MIKKLTQLVRKARVVHHIRGINSRDFSIIASNCTGTLPYRFLKMPYLSPTVNLFFYAPCYLKFASRLDHYLQQELRFKSESGYAEGRATHEAFGRYPVGVLDDIEIHFMHYDSEDDALEKWNKRKQRINREKLIFAFTDRDLCTYDLMQQFDDLPGNKILLTARHCPWLKSAVHIPAYQGCSEMGDGYTNYDTLMDVNYRALIDGTGNAEATDAMDNHTSVAASPRA